MRIAYLDCFSGISGDMFLGAAVDAGVSLEKLQSVAAALGLEAALISNPVQRSGISATKIDVLIQGRPDHPLDEPTHEHEHAHEHENDHEHAHSHEDEHEHRHSHEQGHSQEFSHVHKHSHDPHWHSHAPVPLPQQHTHRGLPEIRQVIARANISAAAKAFAVRTFELLADAEGKIHNLPPESIHFHEVGSEDAIVDIVCAAVAIEAIAADAWYCSALNVGSGTVRCAHGVLPVPAPATAELLRGAPIYSSGAPKELLTPTGAAILKALNVRYEPLPALSLTATGYGAGARELPGMANVVRLILGEGAGGPHPEAGGPYSPSFGECGEHTSAPAGAVVSAAYPAASSLDLSTSDTVVVLEANIDDMNPQIFSYVQQKLLTAGALDAFAVPVQMKKGRPGQIFTVLATPADVEPLSRILLTETTTLGVRMRHEQRRILQRQHVTVQSAWGPIRIKLGLLEGEVVNFAPEFEDCRSIAEANGVPLKTILQQATHLYLASSASATGSAAIPDPAPVAGSAASPSTYKSSS
jgi:uncharacterized protein (TIGR00299 family) protein